MIRLSRFMVRMLAVCLLLSMIGMWAIAQESEDTMMELDLGATASQMQDLAWFIGEWEIVSRYLNDPAKDEWLEETLHSEHTYEIGGHIIFEHFYGVFGGAPFEAWSLRKFNVNTSKWEQRWVDSQPGGFANWTGTWDAESNSFTGYANRFIDNDGKLTGDNGAREVFDNIEADRFSWRYEQTSDGGATWQTTWTLEYTRRKAE